MPILTQLERYQRGGDIYDRLRGLYGPAWADRIAQVAREGGQVNEAIAEAKNGKPLEESTLAILGQQAKDPLAAPLDAVNEQIGNAVGSIFRNKWVVASIAVTIFASLGGFDWLKRQLTK